MQVIEDLEEQKVSQCDLIDDLEIKIEELGNSAKRREADFGAENKALEREIKELKDEIKLAKKEVKILKKEGNKSEHDFFK